jgi:hypothetical protein
MANNPKYAGLTEVGVGAVEESQVNPGASLDGASEYEYVTLTNPLPFTFKGRVAQSRPVNAPIRIVGGQDKGIDEASLRAAGLDLRNQDHPSNAHVTNIIEIKSGASINLRGDEAQVVIKQLVNEVLHYRGNTLKIGAPTYRKSVEDEVITGRKSIDDLLGGPVATRGELVDIALKQKNEEVAFPTVESPVTISPVTKKI